MQSRTLLVFLLAAALVFTFGTASAEGNAANGKTKATSTCASCHGPDFMGATVAAPGAPALAGQYRDYLEQVLHEYKDGQRTSAMMNPMAASLSDQDIQDIAAYLSGLPSKLSDLHGKVQGGN